MKKAIVLLVVAAFAIPTSVAFAKSPHPGTKGKSAPKVMYVLKGTLSSYAPASPTVDGSISITVKHSNFHGRALKGQTLTFATVMSTKVTHKPGVTTISDNSKGVLKFKAPLRVPGGATTMATVLPTMAKALHIIDQARH